MDLLKFRPIVQLAFLLFAILGVVGVGMTGFIYPFFFCYACPYAVASCPIGILEHSVIDMKGNLWAGLQLLAYLLAGFAVVGLLFGRAACGWACPIGFLQDMIDIPRRGILKNKNEWTKIRGPGKFLKFAKYGFLVFVPISTYISNELFYTRFCPVGFMTGTLPTLILFPGEWEVAPGPDFYIKIGTTIFFLLSAVAIGRFWCRFMCPIGAGFGPFNKFSLFRVEVSDKCVDCGMCTKACPMAVDPSVEHRSAECIICGKCVSACKFDACKLTINPVATRRRMGGPPKKRGEVIQRDITKEDEELMERIQREQEEEKKDISDDEDIGGDDDAEE